MNGLYELLIRLVISNCLNTLAQLQQAYFACYIKQDYFFRQSDHEKAINQKRSKWLRKAGLARYWLKSNKNNSTKWQVIFSKVEHLSEIIFSLNQLRFRVHEKALFEMCFVEMQSLEKSSTTALRKIAKSLFYNKHFFDSEEMAAAIHAFEAISDRVLKIASNEPIIFLFFIQDLYALNDAISQFYEKTN